MRFCAERRVATTWRAFWETWVVGKKPKEVAVELGMTVGAVYMARSRVVARLRQLIEGVEREPSTRPRD